MVEVYEYQDAEGRSPFAEWFAALPSAAAIKVGTRLERLRQGNFSKVASVGEGVHEIKIDYGPGYRVYFGKDGEDIVILLGGGHKKRQQNDIEAAHSRWDQYKRKRKERM
jgi:putative addiction module killer protein